jgi:hypothetical protein
MSVSGINTTMAESTGGPTQSSARPWRWKCRRCPADGLITNEQASRLMAKAHFCPECALRGVPAEVDAEPRGCGGGTAT